MIKAIETEYKGYRFRSRLEARWAVFFDALGIKWEYEPQGFLLPSGLQYLPDFQIKGVDTNGDKFDFWCEVKGDNNLSKIDRKKIDEFGAYLQENTHGAYQYGLLLLIGIPEPKTYENVGCPWPHFLWSARKRPWFDDYDKGLNWFHDYHYSYQDSYITGDDREPLNDLIVACNAAKSARFEFGEHGALKNLRVA